MHVRIDFDVLKYALKGTNNKNKNIIYIHNIFYKNTVFYTEMNGESKVSTRFGKIFQR